MNIFELDRAIKYYSKFNDLESIKIVRFYKNQRPKLINKINKELKQKGIIK